jgi:hypothetical protein
MSRPPVLPLLLAAGLLIPASDTCAQQGADQPVQVGTRVGQFYADYTLPLMRSGELRSLSSFRGRKIVLIQFASW